MNGTAFKGQLERGKVTAMTVTVSFPDGTRQDFEVDASDLGGVIFDDGVMKDLVQARVEAGGAHWAEALPLWEAGGADWQHRPSYILLPTVDFDRCGTGNCPAAKNGQCIGGGQCAR